MQPPEIKNPCPMRWDAMHGDERQRFCEHCQLHVHNLSAMSSRSAAQVLARAEHERVCITYTKRADGSFISGWDNLLGKFFKPFRRGFAWILAATAPIVFGACQTQNRTPGYASSICKARPKKTASAQEDSVIVTGGGSCRALEARPRFCYAKASSPS